MVEFKSANLVHSIASAALAPLLFGYHLAELNAPEAAIRCVSPATTSSTSSFPSLSLTPCIQMSTAEFGLATSIFAFGGLIGALLGGPICNNKGRRGALLICSVGFTLGGFVMALANNLGTLVLGRVIGGIAAGAAIVVTPLYIHDLAPKEKKGSYGAITQISVNTGILLTQTEGLWLSKEQLWRIILASGGVLGALQFILLLKATESPKWLLSRGDRNTAIKALAELRGHTVSGDEVDEEYREDEREDQSEEAEEGRSLLQDGNRDDPSSSPNDQGSKCSEEKIAIWTFLTKSKYRKALIAVVGIMLVQQLTGINAIVMYGVSVLRDLFPNSAALINVFISLTNLVFTFTASRYFDLFGRKPYLIASIVLMGLNSLLLGIGMTYHIPVLSAITTILFVSSFSIGLGPIPWMVAAETVPFNASGAAQSISLAANWIGTFIVSYGFPVLAQQIGKGNVFFIFFGIAIVSLVFVELFIPETKGRGVKEAWEEHGKTVRNRWCHREGEGRLRVD